MAILGHVFTTETGRSISILTLERPDSGWGWFRMWRVSFDVEEHVKEYLRLERVYPRYDVLEVVLARRTPAMPLLRWWFTDRYVIRNWAIRGLIRSGLFAYPGNEWFQWGKFLRSFSLRRGRQG